LRNIFFKNKLAMIDAKAAGVTRGKRQKALIA
jgi:hypothetical protein